MLEWTEIRDFLAVAEAGSFSGAARKLNISQPTVGRRMASLEDALGGPLFIRARTGLQLTRLGERVLDHARRMEDEANHVELITAGRQAGLRGRVTVSAIGTFGSDWLIGNLAQFRRDNPNIEIELTIAADTSDIMRREADIAIRMYEPRQLDLIARKIGRLGYGLFASKEYLAEHGEPKTPQDLKEHEFVVPAESVIRFVRDKFAESVLWGKPAFVSNSLTVLGTATANGFGIGVHSFLLAAQLPMLVRILPDIVPFEMDFWLVTHPDLRRSPRVRAVWNFLSELIQRDREFLLTGAKPKSSGFASGVAGQTPYQGQQSQGNRQ